jgi:hypothetical protein
MHVSHAKDLPDPHRVYRCPVCHLQMKFDTAARKMQPVPPNGPNDRDKPRRVA